MADSFEAFVPILLKDVMPCLDRCQDVYTLDTQVNSTGALKFNAMSPYPEGAYTSVILAKLADNPEFEALIGGYQSWMTKYERPTNNTHWNNLLAYLRNLA